jgi:hypothetical protein
MKLEIEDVEQSTSDTKGQFAAIGVRTRQQDRHLLLMPLKTGAKLMSMICNAGLLASEARGGDGATVELVDFPAAPTTVNACIGAKGGVDLVLRFGQVSMSATLDPTRARRLAEQLLQATAAGPTTTQ